MLNLSETPIEFEEETARCNIFFDEVNQIIFTVRSGGQFTNITGRGPNPDDPPIHFSIAEKAEGLTSLKLAPNRRIVAIQRCTTSVDFVNLKEDGSAETQEYNQACKSKSAILFGIVWSIDNDILFISNHGLELYQVYAEKKKLSKPTIFNLSMNWYVFSPQHQLIVASSGTIGNTLNPLLIFRGSIVKFPKFDVDLGPNQQVPKLTLLDRDVNIISVYGDLYCTVLRHSVRADVDGAQVLMYRLSSKESVPPILEHTLHTKMKGHLAMHCCDNVIIVHNRVAKTSIIFDINLQFQSEMTDLDEKSSVVSYTQHKAINIKPLSIVVPESKHKNKIDAYSDRWAVFLPDIIIDPTIGLFWRLQMNVNNIKAPPIVEICSSSLSAMLFLLNRRDGKDELLRLMTENIYSLSVHQLNHLFASIIDSATNAQQINGGKQQSINIFNTILYQSMSIGQHDLYMLVLQPLFDRNVEIRRLVNVILQLMLVIHERRFTVHVCIDELLVHALAKTDQYRRMHQLIEYGVIADRKKTAFALMSLESRYTPAAQLAIDMITRLPDSQDELLEILLANDRLIDAVKCVDTANVDVLRFVEAVWKRDRLMKHAVITKLQDRHAAQNKGDSKFAEGDRYERYMYEFQRLYTKSEKEQLKLNSDKYVNLKKSNNL